MTRILKHSIAMLLAIAASVAVFSGSLYAQAEEVGSPALQADQRADNSSDTPWTRTLASYDEEIKKLGTNIDLSNQQTKLLTLQRAFVAAVGYDKLQTIAAKDDNHAKTIKWLMTDLEALNMYVSFGEPNEVKYEKSLDALTKVYTGSKTIEGTVYKFADDLNNTTASTKNGRTIGQVMKTLMISIAMTHDDRIYYWTVDSTNSGTVDNSKPEDRYWILRTFRMSPDKYKFSSNVFDTLNVAEMRMVTGAWISDRQLAWLNWYVRTKKPNQDYNNAGNTELYCGYGWLTYTTGWSANNGYSDNKFFNEENRTTYEEKYHLSTWNDDDPMLAEYDLPYGLQNGKKEHAPWIVFEKGGVCGAMSKTGQNVSAAFGRPSIVVPQPGHAAHLYFNVNSKGEGTWHIHCDISGWGQSGIHSWDGTTSARRDMLLDWGNGQSGWGAHYTLAAQNALNYKAENGLLRGEAYAESDLLRLTAAVYEKGSTENIALLQRAKNIGGLSQRPNLRAWEDLASAYKAKSASQDEWGDLAKGAAEAFTWFPGVQIQFFKKSIEPNLQVGSNGWKTAWEAAIGAVDQATRASDSTALQYDACKAIAKGVQGNVTVSGYQKAIASLSGQWANTIIALGDAKGNQQSFSLDGGTTWKNFTDSYTLTAEEVASLTAQHGIKVKFANGTQQQIKLTVGNKNFPEVWVNDRENRLYNIPSGTEISVDAGKTWKKISGATESLGTGDLKVLLRKVSSGLDLPSNPVTFTLTADEVDPTLTYIPASKLSAVSASSEALEHNNAKENALDGNGRTLWHSDWNGDPLGNDGKWIVIKLPEFKMISGVEYFSRQDEILGGIIDGLTVYTSMDGVNWNEVGAQYGWDTKNFNEVKKPKFIELETPSPALYVKLKNNTDSINLIHASIINVFEDTTAYDQIYNYEVAVPDFEVRNTADTDAIPLGITNSGVFPLELSASLVNQSTADALSIQASTATVRIEPGATDNTSFAVVAKDGLAAGGYKADVKFDGKFVTNSTGLEEKTVSVSKPVQVVVAPRTSEDGSTGNADEAQPVAGTDYVMIAHDITLSASEASTIDSNSLISRAGVAAMKKADVTTAAGTVTVSDDSIAALKAAQGGAKLNVPFNLNEEANTQVVSIVTLYDRGKTNETARLYFNDFDIDVQELQKATEADQASALFDLIYTQSDAIAGLAGSSENLELSEARSNVKIAVQQGDQWIDALAGDLNTVTWTPGEHTVKFSYSGIEAELVMTVTGEVPVPTYTVTFKTNGGSAVEALSAKEGESITLPESTREGYTFKGWFSDEALTTLVGQAGASYQVNANATLYAGWAPCITLPVLLTNDHVNYVLGRESEGGERYVAPLEQITRAEVATMLYRVLDESVRTTWGTTDNSFTDVPADAWYAETVSTLANLGVIKGNDDGSFAPDRLITRAEIATIMARLDENYEGSSDTPSYGELPFIDVSKDYWAYQPLTYVYKVGWIKGDEAGNTFRPDDALTRAEAAAFINRMLVRTPETEADLLPNRVVFEDNKDKGAWYYLTVEEAVQNHDFARKEDGISERWTALKDNLSWLM